MLDIQKLPREQGTLINRLSYTIVQMYNNLPGIQRFDSNAKDSHITEKISINRQSFE